MFNTFDRIKIFISSYLPLYLWLLFKSLFLTENKVGQSNYSNLPSYTNIVLIILIIISFCPLLKLRRLSGADETQLPEGVNFKPMSDSFMNYIVTYFTPLMSFDNTNLESVLMNLGIFTLIGFMCISSNAIYLNPVLGVFGYRLYEVENFPHSHHIITRMKYDELTAATQNAIKLNKYKISDGVHLLKKSEFN